MVRVHPADHKGRLGCFRPGKHSAGHCGDDKRRPTRGNHIVGVVRINAGLRRGLEGAYSGVSLGDVAQRNFTLARESDIIFDIVQRMARHHASMAVVTKIGGRYRPSAIVGVISKEHIADSVAESIKPFGK
jgi:CIC family chloride channel protein